MLTREEDVEIHALHQRGWSISAIARHLGRDRKTVRAYLSGERSPGVRRPAGPDPLAPYSAYVTARFVDDPQGSVTEAANVIAQVTAKLEAAIAERQRAIADRQRTLRDRWSEGKSTDTESLRETLLMYRTFLDQLTGPKAG